MVQPIIVKFLQDQWWKAALADLTGKTVVVIGANAGLGFEAAKHFASMNPKRLVLVCRNQGSGQGALKAIQATGFKNAELSLIDLAQFASVSAFADNFILDGAQIDILVYNIAIVRRHYIATKDGWEASLQVNHLSALLLTIFLLPCLLKAVSSGTSPNPRIVVSSEGHQWAKFTKEEVESDKILQKISDKIHCISRLTNERHSLSNLSKLLNVFFVRELTKRLPANSPVVVTAVDPGLCKSHIEWNANASLVDRILGKIIMALLIRTTEECSRQLVWAAVGGAGREFELRGDYVNMANLEKVSDFVLSDEGVALQTRLWDESVEILSGVEPKFERTLRVPRARLGPSAAMTNYVCHHEVAGSSDVLFPLHRPITHMLPPDDSERVARWKILMRRLL